MILEKPGCGDNSCMFGSPGGMATNGGCQCLPAHMTGQERARVRRGVQLLRQRITELESTVRIYGGHIPNCPGRPCECGFQHEWDKLPRKRVPDSAPEERK